jgi:hypothetical protein
MSVTAGPNLYTSNLQIHIDFTDPQCYSGGSTTTGNFSTFTNLVNSQRNNGYLKNNCTLNTLPTGTKYVTTGGANSGALYNVGDRIDINTSAAGIDRFGANNFSIMFWVNQGVSGGRMMSTGSAGTGTGDSDNCLWQMWCDSGRFYWWNSTGGETNALNTTINTWHTPGTWQLIGFTYSYNEGGNNIVRCYTNGVQQFTASIATSTHSFIDRSGDSIMQWTLGGGYASSCFNTNAVGSFATFSVYNARLSDRQMRQNFEASRSRFGV